MSASNPHVIEITAAHEHVGQRIDRMLAAALPDFSRSRLKSLIESGCLNSGEATIAEPSYRVKPGEVFVLTVPPAAPAHLEGQAIDLAVVHEDDDVIVIDKPAGLVVHPAPGNPERTLVNALIAHCGDSLRGIGGERRPGIVHRLDKETSGLIVAAKTETAHTDLVRQFAAREVERSYKAVVRGVPAQMRGELTGNIGRSPHNRKKMAVLANGGRPAVTRYRVEAVFAQGAASLLKCRLLTGRTHQIRVHLAAAGHPLVGDPLYGGGRNKTLRRLSTDTRNVVEGFSRQVLHAATLGFRHPASGAWLSFESDLPGDLKALIAALAGED